MLKLNVGFNKKVGEANYGSRGASVGLELDLDSLLVEQPERLKERIRSLFGLAKTSVDEELSGHATQGDNGNGHPAQGNGRRRDATRRATASQARALVTIADRRQIDLAHLLHERFGIDQAGDLSITEASQLIDELKAPADGQATGGRR